MAEIIMGTPAAKELESAVQKKLAEFGYAPADDTVMAEYVVVMLANAKTPDDISHELKELIGDDSYDAAFTAWLFEEVARRFSATGGSDAQTPAPAAAPADTGRPSDRIETAPDSRDPRDDRRNNWTTRGRGAPGGVFNQAMGGLKRPAGGDLIGGARSDGPPIRRMRMDDPAFGGAPTGPRQFADNRDGMRNGAGDRRDRDGRGLRGGRGGGGRSLMERTGGPHPGSFMSNGPPGYDPLIQSQIMQQQQQQQHQMLQMGMPFPQNGRGPQPPFFPNPHFPGGAIMPPPFPAFPGASGPQLFTADGRPFFPPAGFPGPGQVLPQPPQAPQKDLSTLPKKPDGTECKYGLACKNAWCPNAHVTPIGDKNSMLLSFEPCGKQIECQDKDCSKAHVSPQQKDPNSSVWAKPILSAPPVPTPPQRPQGAPASNPTPCRFGVACARPDCIYTHPWNAKPTSCKFGLGCTRPDCHFQHPPGRKLGKPQSRNISKTFNANTAPDGIGEMASSEESKMNRLKRFAGGVAAEDAERIIPGQAGDHGPAGNEKVDGNKKEDSGDTRTAASSPAAAVVGE